MRKSIKQNNKGGGFTRQNFFRKISGGFTLVETLVAVSIFSISLIGILYVLSSGISNTNYAKRKMTATYLAQEGIEYIRNMRDNYVLYSGATGEDWGSFRTHLTECGNPGGGNNKHCYFDYDKPNPADRIVRCGNGNGLCTIPLKYDATAGKYGYTSGQDSGFTRSIKVRYPAGPQGEMEVSSIVSWTQGSGNYDITLSATLYNWTSE